MPALAGSSAAPHVTTRNARWQASHDKALAMLGDNVQVTPYVDQPELIDDSARDVSGIMMARRENRG
ncbi:hypothetical protein [Sphingomonas sp. R86521]|uniref:hypothetical protein n=1 Tax=Sphingomonas sp. R86521 TaxID=3093860 RepID=UPI0036D26DB8